ncbi:hypothetical protein FA15DRAFT_671123 [Coprinopsis marcescibilis]|uniref:Nephrocystin 3-like N-terminal domain-containing protein n=1 Tax=Coprinopsis marcescibilis TaxID=230819 RepID=A0A5C3KQF9_COPMA|nr:hypothetical protein FA15DRAFT_671123 [Coprinopsis marcescibilis]
MFDGAQHVTLHDSNVVSVGRDFNTTTNINYAQETPMDTLRRHCAFQATHESETAAYAPRCKQGTRMTVLEDIMGWTTGVVDETAHLSMLWLAGPAGGGKTCIQRDVVQRCEERGILAASYFFSTRVPGLDHAGPFVATIAYQLCTSIPALKPHIEQEIQFDPSLFEKSLEVQFERLIARPFSCLATEQEAAERRYRLRLWRRIRCFFSHKAAPSKNPDLVIIDGLDECRKPEEQVRLIRLLARASSKIKLPLRVAIASRPEYDIRSTYEDNQVKKVTYHIKLEDYGCDTDIEDYLIDSLFEIRAKHPSAANIPADWPSKADVKKVVEKASGQFIYASTFLTFVKNPHRNLTETFTLAVNYPLITSSAINPFATLDALYSVILESVDADPALLRRLLHGLIVMTSVQFADMSPLLETQVISTQFLDKFYNLGLGTTETTFCDLHSLIHIPPPSLHPRESIWLHHKSLEDYILSEARSPKFWQPIYKTDKGLLELCCHHLLPWSNPTYASNHSPTAEALYAARFWTTYASLLVDHGVGSVLASQKFAMLPEAAWSCRPKGSSREPVNPLRRQDAFHTKVHHRVCSARHECIPICLNIGRLLSAIPEAGV